MGRWAFMKSDIGANRRTMTDCKFLFSNGVITSSPDVPPVATLLQSHPGAYTTTRTHSDGACILFWERHLRRLSNSARILLSRDPRLLFKPEKSELSLPPSLVESSAWDSAVESLVKDSVDQVLPIALREGLRKEGEELAITALVSGNVEKLRGMESASGSDSPAEMLDVYVHLAGYVALAFDRPEGAARLAVVGRGRSVAEAKYSDWVRLRKPLERLRPTSVTELLLSNDGDHLLEGCLTNFFVVRRREGKGVGENPYEVQTAPISDGVLPGIIRQLVLEVCLSKGISVQEVAPSWSGRDFWQEAFVTNSLRIIRPVERIQFPHSWESLEHKDPEEISWEEKQFAMNPGRITAIIQNEVMKKAFVEGYPI
ncbi:unnamed protein product [Linum tenue]|uniref:Uncharacterized protein n=1 Tax=Linum tenue TaxID=586396 RepID=A0AAV0M9D9_9ROSI|nr:unnamed protein product [Linum tenue]